MSGGDRVPREQVLQQRIRCTHEETVAVVKAVKGQRCSDGSKFVTETQIISGVSVITAHVAVASTNKTKIV